MLVILFHGVSLLPSHECCLHIITAAALLSRLLTSLSPLLLPRPLPLRCFRDLTRGQGTFSGDKMRAFVESEVRGKGAIPAAAADALCAMAPSTYLGIAPELARAVKSRMT